MDIDRLFRYLLAAFIKQSHSKNQTIIVTRPTENRHSFYWSREFLNFVSTFENPISLIQFISHQWSFKMLSILVVSFYCVKAFLFTYVICLWYFNNKFDQLSEDETEEIEEKLEEN